MSLLSKQSNKSYPQHYVPALTVITVLTVLASPVRCSPLHYTKRPASGLLVCYSYTVAWPCDLCVAFSPTWGSTGWLPQWAVVTGGVVVTGNSHLPAYSAVSATVCRISTWTKLHLGLFASLTACATSQSRPCATPRRRRSLPSCDAAAGENRRRRADASLFSTHRSVQTRQMLAAQSTDHDYSACS